MKFSKRFTRFLLFALKTSLVCLSCPLASSARPQSRAVSPDSYTLFPRTKQAAPDQLNQAPAARLYSIRGAANQVHLRRLLGADVRAAGRDHKQLEQVFAAAGDARCPAVRHRQQRRLADKPPPKGCECAT